MNLKSTAIALAENVKRQLTKQLQLEIDVRNDPERNRGFPGNNFKNIPGNQACVLLFHEPKNNLKANLVTMDNGFEMNNDLIQFSGNQTGN